MLTQYHGNYLKKDRQPIENQSWVEKLAEWSSTSPWVYPIPYVVLLLGIVVIDVILPTKWQMFGFWVMIGFVILAFVFIFFSLIVLLLENYMFKRKKDDILLYIAQNSGCTFSDILNSCYSFKLSSLLAYSLERLDWKAQIIAEIEGRRITFRLPTEEDFARWEAEAEAEAAEWGETWE